MPRKETVVSDDSGAISRLTQNLEDVSGIVLVSLWTQVDSPVITCAIFNPYPKFIYILQMTIINKVHGFPAYFEPTLQLYV